MDMKPHERLRIERIGLGMTQEEVGKLCGVHRRSQNIYESGRRSPDLEYLIKFYELGADLGYVITGERTVTNVLHDIDERITSIAQQMRHLVEFIDQINGGRHVSRAPAD